eukprot:2819392-Pleurochrysis_carterae.AAC.3
MRITQRFTVYHPPVVLPPHPPMIAPAVGTPPSGGFLSQCARVWCTEAVSLAVRVAAQAQPDGGGRGRR